MRWSLYLALVVAAACGIAEAMGHNTRGAPCTHSDRRCVSASGPGPLIFNQNGTFNPDTVTANPMKGATDKYCITATMAASGSNGWTDNHIGGYIAIGAGTFGRNTISLWRNSDTNNCGWRVELDYSDGTYTDTQSNPNAIDTPFLGACYAPTHKVAFCALGTTGYWYLDGVQTNTSTIKTGLLTLPNTMFLGALGAGYFPYQAGDPLSNICISGPSGTASADPTVAVANTCAQFTNTVPALDPFWGCYKCLGFAPDAGAATILALGDSITSNGLGVPRAYPAKLNQLLGQHYSVTQGGVAGNTVAQMKTRYDASYHHAAMFNRCVFLGGVNDIIRNGSSAASTYSTASALLDEMRSDGCSPVIVMPTPVANGVSLNWDATRQTEYDAYRTDLSGYCSTNSLTCVETSVDLGNGATPVQLKSNLDYGDHIHPNQAGMDQLATTVFNGVSW